MADYQRIVDQLRFHLQSDNLELTDELAQLGNAYAEACREANERLRRCGEFLRKGLRSEAIHFAEAEPNLLELAALLDIPERAEWDELVSLYQLKAPEPLLLEIAEQLNEAYAAQQPIEQLLDRHRLLALARAELPRRIAVLRALCSSDGEGANWDEDLRALEQARFREVAEAAKAAARDGDGRLLQSLEQELAETPWCERPPGQLTATLQRLTARQVRIEARQRLTQLQQPLLSAFAALDIEQARDLRGEWDAAFRSAGVPADDPLLEAVAPALGWIEDEDVREAADAEFQKAVARLERALEDGEMPLEDLERLGRDVMRFDRGVPESLSAGYRNRLAAMQLADTRKRRVRIGSVSLGVVLAIAVVGVLSFRAIQSAQVARVAREIEGLVGSGELEQARVLADRHQDFPPLDSWLSAQRTLAAAEKREVERSAEFAALVRQARSEQEPKAALTLLQQAAELARTPEEKLEVAELEGQRQREHRDWVAQEEQKLRAAVAETSTMLSELKALIDRDATDEAFNELFERISEQIAIVEATAERVDAPSGGQAEVFQSRLRQLAKLRAEAFEKNRLLERMAANAVIDSGGEGAAEKLRLYRETLAEFAKSFPNDRRAADFGAALKEAPLWDGMVAWQGLVAEWKQTEPKDLVETRQRIYQCEEFLKEHARSPAAELARPYVAGLKAIRARDEDDEGNPDGGIKSRLLKLYSSDLIANAYVMYQPSGEALYTPHSEVGDGEVVGIEYFTGPSRGELKRKGFTRKELVVAEPALSPQSKVARFVRTELPSVSPRQWRGFFAKVCGQILKEPGMDTFLQYLLLVRTLEYAGAGDAELEMELEPVLRRMRDDNIDLAVRWMVPGDAEAEKARQRAREALLRMGDLSEVWKKAEVRADERRRVVFAPPRMVGFLVRDRGDKWTCRSHWNPKQAGALAVVVPGSDGAAATLRVIGSAEAGQVTLEKWIEPRLTLQGRPVFAVDRRGPSVPVAARTNR